MGYKRRYSLNQPLIIWVFFFFFKKNKTIIYVDLVWFSNILSYTELYIKECTSCEDHRFLHAITSYMLQESDFSFFRYKDPQTSHDPLNIDFIVWHCSIHNENLKKLKINHDTYLPLEWGETHLSNIKLLFPILSDEKIV